MNYQSAKLQLCIIAATSNKQPLAILYASLHTSFTHLKGEIHLLTTHSNVHDKFCETHQESVLVLLISLRLPVKKNTRAKVAVVTRLMKSLNDGTESTDVTDMIEHAEPHCIFHSMVADPARVFFRQPSSASCLCWSE